MASRDDLPEKNEQKNEQGHILNINHFIADIG
jgi:hypothetical protein